MSKQKKFHIGKNGPAPCNANKRACRYGGEGENHYDTMEDADKAYQALRESEGAGSDVMTKKKDSGPTALDVTTKRIGQRMTPEVAALRTSIKERTQNKVAERAANNDITLEDANPERAEKRLKEAIEYASSRKNVHLMEKLSKADVLPSGAFKRNDGTRFNTDQVLDNRTRLKHIESEREKLNKAMIDIARNGNIPAGQKFTAKTSHGTFTASVTEGNFNEAEFTKLPKNVQDQMMKLDETIDVDLVRKHIPESRRSQFMTRTQVFDYVEGKPHDVGQSNVAAQRPVGNNASEQMQSGVNNLAKLYEDSRNEFGKSYKEIKAENAVMTDNVKAAVAANPSTTGNPHTFVPARSQYNGAIVTERENISRKTAAEVLSKEELRAVTVVRQVPDREKAAKVLSPEEFGRIFNVKSVSLRVTEK